jgi:hypothetical protein
MKQQMLKIVLSDLIFLAALYTLTGCGRIEKSRAAHPISKPNDKSILVPTPNPGPVVFTGRGGTVLAITAATMEALSRGRECMREYSVTGAPLPCLQRMDLAAEQSRLKSGA